MTAIEKIKTMTDDFYEALEQLHMLAHEEGYREGYQDGKNEKPFEEELEEFEIGEVVIDADGNRYVVADAADEEYAVLNISEIPLHNGNGLKSTGCVIQDFADLLKAGLRE